MSIIVIILFESRYTLINMKNKVSTKSWISISSQSSSSEDSLENNYSIKTVPNKTRFVKKALWRKQQSNISDHEICLRILYRSMIYVRKHKERRVIDDGMMLQELLNHVTICTYPTPLNAIGQYLLRNGYVLTAFSLLLSRIKKQKIYYGYLMAMFDNTHDITSHKQEFNFYLDMGLQYIDSQFSK